MERSNEIAALQADFDVASGMIKSIIEEAGSVEIPVSNRIIVKTNLLVGFRSFIRIQQNCYGKIQILA